MVKARIEDAVQKDLRFDVLDRIWQRADMDEDEATESALEAQSRARLA